ncbi:NUDIX hydrolase [Haloarcula laminariae]|uniref:NUDIX hydrolase n=1 Tax=Haloarcula laminariae TaxID=2961577 RepID=UPI00387DC8A1
MNESGTAEQEITPPLHQNFLIRPAVKGLITSTDGVLLQKERHTNGEMFWTLPGGGIASQETATGALSRELQEELQTTSVVGRELGRVPYAHFGRTQTISVYRVFGCAILEAPQANPREGVYTYQWADPQDPPTRALPQVDWVLQRYVNRPGVNP